MESSSSRLEEERRKQEELKKKIAFLQAQLVELPDDVPPAKAPTSPKRKNPEPILLAPATPSPSKFSAIYSMRELTAQQRKNEGLTTLNKACFLCDPSS